MNRYKLVREQGNQAQIVVLSQDQHTTVMPIVIVELYVADIQPPPRLLLSTPCPMHDRRPDKPCRLCGKSDEARDLVTVAGFNLLDGSDRVNPQGYIKALIQVGQGTLVGFGSQFTRVQTYELGNNRLGVLGLQGDWITIRFTHHTDHDQLEFV